ncbi:winged helix-turn-helix transcriptional regulator [Nocardiopsis sp. NPDC058789]|uniref:Helix-turn-helix transcriptional regulator n=1 Tax=Nocardiopsis eucommiae TaxID=2831970 RepID=A0A975LAU0_9ACTN|nr:helix-turn-helix transcriptional regulator [Nocardiopsis eucommiae]
MCSVDTARPTDDRLLGPCSYLPTEHADTVRKVLDRVGDKWTMLVVVTLRDGPRRYTDLQRAIPGISQRMLTLTLRRLHEDGLVTRTAHAEVPPRVEYALTPLSRGLLEIVAPLVDWALEHHDEISANQDRTNAASGAGGR